jgi:hypothetical protein
VDRPDEQAAEQIEGLRAKPLLDPSGDAVFQFLRGSLGEGERNNAPRWHAVVEQTDYSLRHDFGLAGAG